MNTSASIVIKMHGEQRFRFVIQPEDDEGSLGTVGMDEQDGDTAGYVRLLGLPDVESMLQACKGYRGHITG